MITTLVIFGATGDLANRLLYPALLRLEALDRLEGVCIIATGREDWTQEQFVARLDEALVDSDGDAHAQSRLTERFVYHCVDLTPESIASLATWAAVSADGKTAQGLSNQTSFLRPLLGGTIHAVARCRHRGRTTWVWEVEISDDEARLCALVRMTVAVR